MTTATQNEYSNATEPVLFRAVALSDNTWKLGCRIGHGHKPRARTMAEDLAMVQHLREGDVRALHCV